MWYVRARHIAISSMLKVLGYRDGQMDKIVLQVHHVLLPVGILLSVPCVYATAHAFFLLMVDYYSLSKMRSMEPTVPETAVLAAN